MSQAEDHSNVAKPWEQAKTRHYALLVLPFYKPLAQSTELHPNALLQSMEQPQYHVTSRRTKIRCELKLFTVHETGDDVTSEINTRL